VAAYAELHCHTNFSFLDGASPPGELADRATELGLSGLAVTDHNGLYGVVRFAIAAREAGLRPIVGVEIELPDPALPDPEGIVVPGRRGRGRHGTSSSRSPETALLPAPLPRDGLPARPRPARARLPGYRDAVREDLRGVGEAQRGPHLVLLARNAAGYRSLCRLVSRANLAGTKSMPRFSQALLAEHTDGLVALSGCREGEIARRLRVGDREGARAVAERYALLFAGRKARRDSVATSAFFLEMQHHLLPDDDWLVAETALLAEELGLPVVVTNDVHYARPEGRELHDIVTAIRHGRSLDELRDLRRPDGESFLKSVEELMALPPGGGTSYAGAVRPGGGATPAGGAASAGGALPAVGATIAGRATFGNSEADARTAAAWAEGIGNAGELAASCSVDLGFERYRFPGYPIPKGHTPFSYLEELCHEGARRRYHPMTSAVVKQLAHEMDVIERTGLAEFFLICWDIIRFARSRGIPAQGRGSAADSIVAYVLGITRVDPIRHNLLFERFINEGRTSYPDVDIDFSSERREEVIQYVYGRYGPEHTGMVCNLVTYRARSAVREVGYALGFPRPLVHRVAKAIETYDSVMVRRDLEADGGFGQFFSETVEREAAVDEVSLRRAAEASTERGLTDSMGELNLPRSGNGGDVAPRSPFLADTTSRRVIRGVEHEAGPRAASERRESAAPRSGSADAGRSASGVRGYHAYQAYVMETGGAGPRVDRAGAERSGGPGDSPASLVLFAVERAAAMRASAAARATPERGHAPHSGVARVEPRAEIAVEIRRGSTVGMPDWERWLAFCGRIDGFPRHLSIHSGGMLVTAAPLIDIAPLERATMADRVVVQFDKRDIETMKLIKLDLLGLGMLAAIDETLQLIEHDCGACIDLDRLPEDLPEVFEMLQAADTVGVFQVESRAQMQTLPKSKPANLDDLVVEVAIIRPGTIQGNAVHPYLRRRQGLEPVAYLHPSLEPVLRETLGVILYQEQVMQIAITVAGFSAGESDGFRRAMGTWRSSREMEKLHAQFVEGCRSTNGLTDEQAEELFRQVAAFASFGFAKSHAAAFARTAYESAFLKLFYQAQFTVGLINAQPMGFYPVEVLINDAKRHGVAVLPVDVNASTYKTATEWVGRDGEPLPKGAGIARRPAAVRSSGCIVPTAASRARRTPEEATGYGIRLGLSLVKGIGDEHAERLDAELARGPYVTLADVVARTELPEEVIERLIRAGALDSLGRPRRELLWQLREVMGAARGRANATRGRIRADRAPLAQRSSREAGLRGANGARRHAGTEASRSATPMDLRLPPTPAPELPALTERERLGDSYSVLSLDANRQVISLFRPALERLGAVTNASLADRGPGPVRLGGLVVTRQHPMTARGTVFLALEDETGMVNVTLWPHTWARLRGVVRRHALLYVEGMLQREASVVNVVAREIKPLPGVAEAVGGPERPEGVRALGYSGMRRG
jgi:error-prone DNA polymerase